MSQALRKLSSQISRSNTVVIFLNQLRMKIGVLPGHNPETTAGGNALKFYASVRIDVRAGERVKEGENVIGRDSNIRIVKNKVAAPFKKSKFTIYFENGVSKQHELLTMAVELGIVEKSGAWYRMGKEPLGQGIANAAEWLKANPERAAKLEKQVRATFARKPVEVCEPEPDAEGTPPVDDAPQPARAAA
jgi:recombination protein RecA